MLLIASLVVFPLLASLAKLGDIPCSDCRQLDADVIGQNAPTAARSPSSEHIINLLSELNLHFTGQLP